MSFMYGVAIGHLQHITMDSQSAMDVCQIRRQTSEWILFNILFNLKNRPRAGRLDVKDVEFDAGKSLWEQCQSHRIQPSEAVVHRFPSGNAPDGDGIPLFKCYAKPVREHAGKLADETAGE